MGIYTRTEMEEILKRYGDTVYRMAFIQVKNRDTADDIYQDVWMKLLRQKSRIEPEKYRTIIHLYYYEDYSQKEIADMLHMKENTVASRMARGRERLKNPHLHKEVGILFKSNNLFITPS